MTQTPETFPPPDHPALWAPRLRTLTLRYFAWMDTRKARRLSRVWHVKADTQWLEEYSEWWMTYGWQIGADTPDVAMLKVRLTRSSARSY